MPSLGAHMSISGGYYRAVEIARECGCDCVQLFTKNNNQWRAKPITASESMRFHDSLVKLKITAPLSHSSYLINLASPDETLWRKSIDAMIVELRRADELGIRYVVVHPGAHTTATEDEGIENVARALNEIHRTEKSLAAQVLLENTAGQGSCIGWRFEHLSRILAATEQADLVGVCFDTCHALAAGYPLAKKSDYAATFAEFDRLVGCDRIRAFHLNDSKKELGSRVDRHEQIGLGHVGIDAFRHLLNDERFQAVPMYLETPKGDNNGEPWDVTNLRTLRDLVRGGG